MELVLDNIAGKRAKGECHILRFYFDFIFFAWEKAGVDTVGQKKV